MKVITHKIHHIGMSGVIFTKCGDTRGSRASIKATDDDNEVTCTSCLKVMATNQENDILAPLPTPVAAIAD